MDKGLKDLVKDLKHAIYTEGDNKKAKEIIKKFANDNGSKGMKRKELLNTPPYFSDILRFLLLEKYAGIWIDVSLFFWKSVENIVKSHHRLVMVRNRNNDNGICKGYESWFIASVPNHPFIKKVKEQVVKLNTYNKIKQFNDNRDFEIQKNTHREYHLIYHIISRVQQKYPETLKDCYEYDSDKLYANSSIPNLFDIPCSGANSNVLNHSFVFHYVAAKKIEQYIKYGEPDDLIASKLTAGVRYYVSL